MGARGRCLPRLSVPRPLLGRIFLCTLWAYGPMGIIYCHYYCNYCHYYCHYCYYYCHYCHYYCHYCMYYSHCCLCYGHYCHDYAYYRPIMIIWCMLWAYGPIACTYAYIMHLMGLLWLYCAYYDHNTMVIGTI